MIMEVGDMILEWGGDNEGRGYDNGSGDMIMEVGDMIMEVGKT